MNNQPPEGTLVETGTFKSAKHDKVKGALVARHEFEVFQVILWKLDGRCALDRMQEIACAGLDGTLDEFIFETYINFQKAHNRFHYTVEVFRVVLIPKE